MGVSFHNLVSFCVNIIYLNIYCFLYDCVVSVSRVDMQWFVSLEERAACYALRKRWWTLPDITRRLRTCLTLGSMS